MATAAAAAATPCTLSAAALPVSRTMQFTASCSLDTSLGSRIGARKLRVTHSSGGRTRRLAITAKLAELPTVDQQQLVDEVKKRLSAEQSSLRVGKNGRDDEDLLLWFLKDRKYDVDATVAKLTKALTWRRDFGVDEISEETISDMAATGKAYLHSSPDVQGRPVVIVRAACHYPDPETLIPSEKLCIYLVEKSLTQLPPGGDQILGIFDLRGFTSKNGDLKFVKFLIDVFFNYYPKRLGEVLFVDAPFIFQPGWNMVKPLLKSYASLVKFCSAADVREQFFTSETVPPDFRETSEELAS